MPRQSRIDAPGALHHIIARGIGRREIFDNDRGRDDFLDRLSEKQGVYTFDKTVPSGKKLKPPLTHETS